MNARQSAFNAVAAAFTQGNPMRVPHCSTSTVCNAMHDWYLPGHNDLAAVLAVYAGVIRKSALSNKCRDSVIDQLHELMDQIDQDLANQKAEQEWNEQQGRRV